MTALPDLAFSEDLSLLPVGLAAPFGGTVPAIGSGAAARGTSLATMGGELVFVGGVLQLVGGRDAVRQAAECRLRTFRGEWFLDAAIGVPWVEQVLGRRNAAPAVRSVIRNELMAIEGVTGVPTLDLRFDAAARTMLVNFVLQTAAGDVAGSVAP